MSKVAQPRSDIGTYREAVSSRLDGVNAAGDSCSLCPGWTDRAPLQTDPRLDRSIIRLDSAVTPRPAWTQRQPEHEPFHDEAQGRLVVILVLVLKTLISLPTHAFRFIRELVQQRRRSSQTKPDSPGSLHNPVVWTLITACVAELVTLPATESRVESG